MNKSMKQIADELGIDKQKVYRFINKECIKEVAQSGQTKLYDEAAQNRITAYFNTETAASKSNSEINQNEFIETLLKQIETLENDKKWLQEQIAVKDQQIRSWEGAAAQFSMHANEQKLIEENTSSEAPKKKRHWWQRKVKDNE